ncbi:MAG: hypothetical protein KDD19_07075 [Phaeodactylibacter sp.]|nr:hypothetical protein [Phaeodactylibacter sp.]MCB9048193.1 hypothetical protein [Lewinellaceae bacterium]
MRSSLVILSFFTLALWGCSGNTSSNGSDGATSGDSTAVEAEKQPTRPAMLNRKNRVPFEKKLEKGPIRFHLSSPNMLEENTLVVGASGFETRNDTFQLIVEGLVREASIADLDADGFPEVYAFAQSTGEDSTAYVYGFSSFSNRSYGQVGVTGLEAFPEMAKGFNGHDRFFLEGSVLKRSFPIFEQGKDSGKRKVITYGLRQGEASFILEPVSSEVVE